MFNIHFIILFKVYVVSPLRVRPYQRSAPSTAFVMPSVNFWDKDEVIVVSPQRNYTVNDYQTLFNDIQFPTGYDYWINNKDLLNELKPPEIESHEIYGSQMPTPGVLLYNNRTFPDLPPVVLPDNGDGTVNIRSLLGFTNWQGKQKDDIHSFEIPGVDHLAILRHPMTINYVIQVLTGQFDRK
jgi:lysophospholipase-3